jgi:molecular chaperone GrpE
MTKTEAENPTPAETTEGGVAGSARLSESQKLTEDAELFCAGLEQFFRRVIGEVPKATDMGEIRAQQAAVRELVQRALSQGGGSGEIVSALTLERDKFKDAAARARADFLNYQNRTAKELERAEELCLRRYVSELLPILDSMDLALQDAKGSQGDLERLTSALEMIATSMNQVLQVRGLERIQARGKPFDPTVHEAVAKRPAEADETPNSVAEELRPGYLWKGLLLRPSQVLVADAVKK